MSLKTAAHGDAKSYPGPKLPLHIGERIPLQWDIKRGDKPLDVGPRGIWAEVTDYAPKSRYVLRGARPYLDVYTLETEAGDTLILSETYFTNFGKPNMAPERVPVEMARSIVMGLLKKAGLLSKFKLGGNMGSLYTRSLSATDSSVFRDDVLALFKQIPGGTPSSGKFGGNQIDFHVAAGKNAHAPCSVRVSCGNNDVVMSIIIE